MNKLRLTHNGLLTSPQNLNSILIPDIDLENTEKSGEFSYLRRTKKRNPANKQPAYVPLKNPFDEAQPGFIDLRLSGRVQKSYEQGFIHKCVTNGWLLATIFDDTILSNPAITSVALSGAINGEMTIDGTGFTSIAPDVAALLITVPYTPQIDLQFLQAEIIAAPYGGTWSAVQVKFTVPITSTLGQILRNPTTLLVSIYSDGVISDEYQFDWVP